MERELFEREKELACLYSLSELFLSYHEDEKQLLEKVEKALREAMSRPGHLDISLRITKDDQRHKNYPHSITSDLQFQAAVRVGEEDLLILNLIAHDKEAMPDSHEEGLIKSVMQMSIGAIQRLRSEADVRAKNATLTELINHLQEARTQDEKTLRLRMKSRIFPLLNEIENGAAGSGIPKQQLKLLRDELDQINYSTQVTNHYLLKRLTPRQIEICNLVGKGVVTKDIAEMLNISPETVERHRCSIRKKLGISGSNTNLTTYLMNL